MGESRKVVTGKVMLKDILRHVEEALADVKYGEIIIKVQGGKPIWIDSIERKRIG
ncbi:MAG: DUF2292 domain-containing protein [Bacillota bacterium]|jgi:hypothetical protein